MELPKIWGIASVSAITLIQLAALFIALDALQVTASFSLRAFKDTRFPFIVMCSVYWLITLPLGYYLGIVVAQDPEQGTVGFWKAMIAGIALSTSILMWRLARTLRGKFGAASDAATECLAPDCAGADKGTENSADTT